MGLEYYLYYIYYTFLGMPFIVRVSAVSLSFFLPMYLLCSHIFLKNRRFFYRTKNIDRDLEKKYKEPLYSIITSERHLLPDDLDQLLPSKIKKLNKKRKERLTKLICSIHHEAPRINIENNRVLIEYLDIRQFWEKKLKHGSLIQKRKSLLRLEDLKIRVSGSILTDLTYHRNKFLRKRSRSSYLSFTRNDPFKFLEEDFDATINNWDRIELHHILEKRAEKGGLPNLARWVLRSDNLDFQCFMVDEIAHFNQQENIPVLAELINDIETPPILRMHCITALSKMKHQEIEPDLFRIYSIQPQYVQRTIIQAIGELATGKALPFLMESYENAIDDDWRIMILSVIYNYGKKGEECFNAMKKKQRKEDFSYLIFEHVSNPLL